VGIISRRVARLRRGRGGRLLGSGEGGVGSVGMMGSSDKDMAFLHVP